MVQQNTILCFSDRETNLHSVLGNRLYRGAGTGLQLNNDICLGKVLSKNELRFKNTFIIIYKTCHSKALGLNDAHAKENVPEARSSNKNELPC